MRDGSSASSTNKSKGLIIAISDKQKPQQQSN
jgi:hypothetical protein